MLDPLASFQHRPIRTLGNIVHESVQTLFQVFLLSLLLLGIGGVLVKALGKDGWLPGLLQSAWHSGPAYLLMVIIALFIVGAWFRRLAHQRPTAMSRAGDTMVFACLALGVFFSSRLIVTGGL